LCEVDGNDDYDVKGAAAQGGGGESKSTYYKSQIIYNTLNALLISNVISVGLIKVHIIVSEDRYTMMILLFVGCTFVSRVFVIGRDWTWLRRWPILDLLPMQKERFLCRRPLCIARKGFAPDGFGQLLNIPLKAGVVGGGRLSKHYG